MLINCDYCGQEFNKNLNQIKRTKGNYCSRSCAAKRNNKLRDPSTYRQPEGKCRVCLCPLSTRLTCCLNCKRIRDLQTLSDIINNRGPRSNMYGNIHYRARKIASKLGWNCCARCNYSLHIEIHHIQPVATFSGDTLILVINDPSNLIPLCPNCHWEAEHHVFDVRLLKLQWLASLQRSPVYETGEMT